MDGESLHLGTSGETFGTASSPLFNFLMVSGLSGLLVVAIAVDFFFLSLASASQILLLPTLISPWLSNLFPLHSPGFCLHHSLPICSSLLFKSDFSFPPLLFFLSSSHPQFGKLYLQPFGGFLGNCKQVSSMWCRQELVHRPAAVEKSWPVKQSTNWGYTLLYISPWHYVSLLKCNKQFNP